MSLSERRNRITMDAAEIFDCWAPREGVWSPWCKSTPFSYMDRFQAVGEYVVPSEGEWEPPDASEGWGLVIDLDGAEAVAFGLQMAKRGYRPVPLFSSVPWPHGSDADLVAVPMKRVLHTLVRGAEKLRALPLPPQAPPAFLLDARRAWLSFEAYYDERTVLDNRTLVLASEFPSVDDLRAGGIHRGMVIIQKRYLKSIPQPDLHHIGLDWLAAELPVQMAHPRKADWRMPLQRRTPWHVKLAQAMACRSSRYLGGTRGVPPVPEFDLSRGHG